MKKIISFIKSNYEDIFKPVAVLLAICIIIPLALSLTNRITADKIAGLEKENEESTMRSLISAETFKEAVLEAENGEEIAYYIAENGGLPSGYIFITSTKGYGGDVSVMTAVNTDGTVKAAAILSAADETPGLGQNVTKEAFYSQYAGKKSGISVVKNGAVEQNNEINAVTGATISSKAVTAAVNEALEQYAGLNLNTGEALTVEE